MKIITTSGALSGRTVVSHAVLQPDTANREELILNLYPEELFQPFLGFGGAVTDSAAYVGLDTRSPGATLTAVTFLWSPIVQIRQRRMRRLSTFRLSARESTSFPCWTTSSKPALI